MKNIWIAKRNTHISELQIERMMKYFDFDMVQSVIIKMGWLHKGKMNPSIDDLKATAKKLLERAAEDDDWSSIGQDCGHGFNVNKLPNGTIVLNYSVELWSEFR